MLLLTDSSSAGGAVISTGFSSAGSAFTSSAGSTFSAGSAGAGVSADSLSAGSALSSSIGVIASITACGVSSSAGSTLSAAGVSDSSAGGSSTDSGFFFPLQFQLPLPVCRR